MQQRWKAVWREAGGQREFVFDSISNRVIARIDGRLKAQMVQVPMPDVFELEEVQRHGDDHSPRPYPLHSFPS